MSRPTLKSCLWAAAVVAALGLATRSTAKPPDLPVNTEHTVTPEVLPDSEWAGFTPLPGEEEVRQTGYSAPRGVGAPDGLQPFMVRPVPMPFLAHLSATQRRHFASTLLFAAHPLLTLVPTDRLVDLSCDHPACTHTNDPEPRDARIILIGTGVNSDAGLHGEIVPMPNGGHGTIEIGIGFSLNGAPTYKFLVTEFSGCGDCRKDETFTGCVSAFIRALKRDCRDQSGPVEGVVEESNHDGYPVPKTQKPDDPDPLSMQCPFTHQPAKAGVYVPSGDLCLPTVLENLQNLARAEELREKGRRLAEDGFPTAARECFARARQLCPGSPLSHAIAGLEAEAGCEEVEEVQSEYTHRQCGGCRGAGVPGAGVMAHGLLKACHQALTTGRYEHAADLARQAFALDAARVRGDVVVYKLHLLANDHHAGCCEKNQCPGDCCEDCPDCPNCPCYQKSKAETVKMPRIREIVIIGNIITGPGHDFPVTVTVPSGITINRANCPSPWGIFPQTLPVVDPQTVKALDDVLKGFEEQQEEHVYQKGIAKPYRETNDAPAGVGKGE